MADAVKKPVDVRDPAVVDLEQLILGKEEFALRVKANPDGIARVIRKLTDAERASIRAVKHVKNAELAKHFGVSVTTIANIRSQKVK